MPNEKQVTSAKGTPELELAKLIRTGLVALGTRHVYAVPPCSGAYLVDISDDGEDEEAVGNIYIEAGSIGVAYVGALGIAEALNFCEKALSKDDAIIQTNEEIDEVLHVPCSFLYKILNLECETDIPAETVAELLEEGKLQIDEIFKIRIVSTPAGGAPEHIRSKWVGCVMPAKLSMDKLVNVMNGAAVDRWGGYAVHWRDAMEALEKQDPDAAAWWCSKVKTIGLDLVFTPECLEVITEE